MTGVRDARRNLLDAVLAEIGRGEVSFPTHADVALRVRLALDDPDLHLAKAAQIIQAEPLLSARVVAVANSIAFNRTGARVADVRTAVTRVGIRLLRALATAVVMRQMAGGMRSPKFRDLAARLWEHTAHVAALSHILAGRFVRGAAEIALFAGMVHEVNGFYLLSRNDSHPELFLEEGALQAIAADATVGRAVLNALAVPEEVLDAVASLWRDEPPVFPPVTLGDVLRLANGLTPIQSPLQPEAAASPLPLPPAVESQLAEILDQSSDELEQMTAALRY
ncbi:MAG: HDOD domain-containing protein [Rhodocyclaceae bacterium]|nr:HDOD domain-containing protein [Rhodocyclaceae bacterium]MBK6675586.1 HDOD domain-containing protein [Rhodocyclaceae bacterium]MBK9312025.1 HDOD domain-containing protein [Rhodocyclaceae bacterium]MBK9956311.1 HDOD domain-containing protein [Rhodocyclaceae bacterium]